MEARPAKPTPAEASAEAKRHRSGVVTKVRAGREHASRARIVDNAMFSQNSGIFFPSHQEPGALPAMRIRWLQLRHRLNRPWRHHASAAERVHYAMLQHHRSCRNSCLAASRLDIENTSTGLSDNDSLFRLIHSLCCQLCMNPDQRLKCQPPTSDWPPSARKRPLRKPVGGRSPNWRQA